MRKIAIIGASYLQEPLIQKAKQMGLETHVFAWAADDVGEKSADFFYPISITEKEAILDKCAEIGINGICSIASDLAVGTVNYVAAKLGLIGNSLKSSSISTNKYLMKQAFFSAGIPTSASTLVESVDDIDIATLKYPIIVKPIDRSGSRGITELFSADGLSVAIETAKGYGFEKKTLVEEFAEGTEYSVECISWKGNHTLLAITRKYTTGTPHFIETGHIQPSGLSDSMARKVQFIVFKALDALGIKYGASHSELKIDKNGNIKIIEIGARGGGDCICSSLVELSTGIDFVKGVIDVALGIAPSITHKYNKASAIRYILSEDDVTIYNKLLSAHPDNIVESRVDIASDIPVVDSSTRHGYYIMQSNDVKELYQWIR